jgi:hypothetical protein
MVVCARSGVQCNALGFASAGVQVAVGWAYRYSQNFLFSGVGECVDVLNHEEQCCAHMRLAPAFSKAYLLCLFLQSAEFLPQFCCCFAVWGKT